VLRPQGGAISDRPYPVRQMKSDLLISSDFHGRGRTDSAPPCDSTNEPPAPRAAALSGLVLRPQGGAISDRPYPVRQMKSDLLISSDFHGRGRTDSAPPCDSTNEAPAPRPAALSGLALRPQGGAISDRPYPVGQMKCDLLISSDFHGRGRTDSAPPCDSTNEPPAPRPAALSGGSRRASPG